MRKPQQQRQSLKMRERWAKRKKWKNVSGGAAAEGARAKLKMRQRTDEAGRGRESKKWTHPRNLSARSNSRTDCVCVRRPPRKQYSPSFLHLRSFTPIILWRASEGLASTKRRGRRSGRAQCSPKSSLFARPPVRLSSKFKPTTMIGRQREDRSAEEIVYLSARPDRLFADTFDVDGWSWLSQGERRLLLKIQGPTFSASSGEGRF